MTTRERHPLFLASALSMLAGCWAIEHGLDLAPGQLRGLLLLAGTLQVYEAVLIALAVAVARTGLHGQLRTLITIEAAFLLDVALAQLEIATASLRVGTGLTGLLLALLVAKWNVLAFALGVRLPLPVTRLAFVEAAATLCIPVAFASLADWRVLENGLWAIAWLVAGIPVAHALVPAEPGGAGPGRMVAGICRVAPAAALGLHLLAAGWVFDVAPWPALLSPLLLGLAARTILVDAVVPRLPIAAVLLALLAPREASWTLAGVEVTPWRLTLVGAAIVWHLAARRVDPLANVLVATCGALVLAGAGPERAAGRLGQAVDAVAANGALGWGMLAVALAFVLLAAGARLTLGPGTTVPPPPSRLRPPRLPLVQALVAGACGVGVMAVAAPSPHRARVSANESATIGWMRTVVSAEASWAEAHEGAYTAPDALGEGLGTGVRSGYTSAYHPRPDGYVLTAVPVKKGTTGVRSFAATEDGRICAVHDGRTPLGPDGTLAPTCLALR